MHITVMVFLKILTFPLVSWTWKILFQVSALLLQVLSKDDCNVSHMESTFENDMNHLSEMVQANQNSMVSKGGAKSSTSDIRLIPSFLTHLIRSFQFSWRAGWKFIRTTIPESDSVDLGWAQEFVILSHC